MKNTLGLKIKKARESASITQKQLAETIGCSEIMISRYELGVNQVSIPQLEKIAKAVDKPISYFFGDRIQSTSMNSTFKESFVFDLDDTLVDGRQFCGETIARVITEVDPSVDFELVCQLHENIRGMAIEDLYFKILKKLDIKHDINELLRKDFIIQKENIGRMKIFDGVIEILDYLKSNNKKVYLCTNRSTLLLLDVLESNNILSYFDEVISCSDAGYKKPNPYCLIDIIKRSGLNLDKFIYFGDSEVDSMFAKNAGIDHIVFDQYMNNKNLFKKLVNMFLEKQINGDKVS